MTTCPYCGHPETDEHNSGNDEPCEDVCAECMFPRATCRDCGVTIERMPEVGWVDVRSGDDGGTYDNCPRGIDLPHRPEGVTA